MRLGILAGVCSASQLTRFAISSNVKWWDFKNRASGDEEYAGTAFLFYSDDDVAKYYGNAYFHNFNALAHLLDTVADTPDSENRDANLEALRSISLEVYTKYKSQDTFKMPVSTPFKNDYSSRAFNWIYEKRLASDIQKSPDLHVIFLRKLLEFYSDFFQQLAQDGKISEHAGMFPFQEMATDLLKGLVFMSKQSPDEMNPLIGKVSECLISFHCASSRLCTSLEENSSAAICDFQEHFDSLHKLANEFASLYDSFNMILCRSPEMFDVTELVLMYTINRFTALISMMHMLSLMEYKMDPSGCLMINERFLESLSKLVVHVILSSLNLDICMGYAVQDIRPPSSRLIYAALNSVKQLLLKSYYYTSPTIKNDLGFSPEDRLEIASLPSNDLNKSCSKIMLNLSSEFFRSVFTDNVEIQLGNNTVYNCLVGMFAVTYDLKTGDLVPFHRFVKAVQCKKLNELDFENTGTFAEMVGSALIHMDAMVPSEKRESIKACLEVYAMLDSIVRFSGVGSFGANNTPMYQFLTNALAEANKKKLQYSGQKVRMYRIVLGFIVLSSIISGLLLVLLVLRCKVFNQ